MQDITITFADGPLRGRKYEFEVGWVPIGRLPEPGGLELKGADTSVSRTHAELVEREGDIELHNLSPNGTKVDGKLIIDSIVVRPGARIEIGDRHPFDVEWQALDRILPTETARPQESGPLVKQGPLSSPIVRAVLGVYLAGIAGVAIWLGLAGSDSAAAADDWPALKTAYESYGAEWLDAEQRAANLERAELLVRQLRALRTQGADRGIERVCREIMRIDGEIDSPLFQYGARCLGNPLE